MSNSNEMAVEEWAQTLIERLSPQEQRKLARRVATELRRANAQRMRKNVAPDGTPWPARKAGRRNSGKGPMYRKMAQAKHLKLIAHPNRAGIGFFNRVARIACVAHYGLHDNVKGPDSPRIKYPQRELLGFSDEDKKIITDLLAELLTGE